MIRSPFLKKALAALLLSSGLTAPLSFAQTTNSEYWVYELQPGEHVWKVAHELLTDWRKWQEIVELNDIRNDRLMAAGTTIRIPKAFIEERDSTIEVLDAAGPVTLKGQSGEAQIKSHESNLAVNVGDVITTGDNGSVLIRFEDNTELMLTPNSTLHIERASVVGSQRKVFDVNVTLQNGEAEIKANPNKRKGTHFVIETPAAFATTRGTVYRVRADGNITQAEVTQGKIDVANTQGTTRVPQRFGTVTEKDKAPSKPKQLLKAPLIEPLKTVRYLPARLEWPTQKGAAAYRAQISDKADFSRLVYDYTGPVPKLNIPVEFSDGQYWLRIRGIDQDGLQGLETLEAFSIDARPFPPVVQAPLPNKPSYTGDLTFQWTQPQDVTSFVFELSKDVSFEQSVITLETDQTQLIQPIDEAGQYYWRVTSISTEGKKGPVGFTNELEVKPTPQTPELAEPEATEESLNFAWQKDPTSSQYQVQLALDAQFEKMVEDVYATEAFTSVPRPEMGTYYFRVRGIDADQYPGGWSAIQKLEVPLESYKPLMIWTVFTAILFL